ncbi:MAG: MBL fold metallo-hydrolase [Lachnospiraceae bacterium]|nr:MBL fold metallo-hydrolase [Lachnospiraceae bacterium]
MRMKSIASGSSGNSIYVGTDTAHVLVDAGISGKKIEAGLKELELCGNDLDGILITHEHADHIGGLGVMLRRYQVPVYATKGTIEAMKRMSSLGKVDWDLFIPIDRDEDFSVKDLTITPLRISHDAAEPVAYRFKYGNIRTAVVTDLGEYDDYIVGNLQGLSAVYLEANHDIRMLQLGRYPYQLKQRILGKKGHLSNEAAGRLLTSLLHDNMKRIFLSHLSHENNLPELAYEAVRMEVEMSDTNWHGDDFRIDIARRDCPSECIAL